MSLAPVTLPLTDVLAVGERQASLELDLVDPVEAVEPLAQIAQREVRLVEPAEQEDPGIGRGELLLVVDTGVTFAELPQAEKLADVVVFERPEETRQRGRRKRQRSDFAGKAAGNSPLCHLQMR